MVKRLNFEEFDRLDKINLLMKMYDVDGNVEFIETFRKSPFAVYYVGPLNVIICKQFRKIQDVEKFCQKLFADAQKSDSGKF